MQHQPQTGQTSLSSSKSCKKPIYFKKLIKSSQINEGIFYFLENYVDKINIYIKKQSNYNLIKI